MPARNIAPHLTWLLLGALGAAAAFAFLIEAFVIPPPFRSYQELLLDEVPGPRIIVDSGSNSRHGIDPLLLQETLGQTTIVAADNASVPFGLKIRRLEKYAQPGDTIILPLEWLHYYAELYRDYFLDRVAGVGDMYDFSGYYHALSRWEKTDFVLRHMNLKYFVGGLLERMSSGVSSTYLHRLAILNNDRLLGVHGDAKDDRFRIRHFNERSCRDLLAVSNQPLSSKLSWAADRLARLQASRRVRVIITWPAVAGDDCYDAAQIDAVASRIRSIFTEAGVAVVSVPERSRFGEASVLDMSYHIDIAAARERTRRLIEDLAQAGLTPERSGIFALDDFATARIERIEREVLAQALKPIEAGIYKVGSHGFNQHVYLAPAGWQTREAAGVWSKGDRSLIVMGPSTKNCAVALDFSYLQAGQTSVYSVNGGPGRELTRQPLVLEDTAGPTVIELRHSNVKSPKELGWSPDERDIFVLLRNVVVDCNKASK